MSRFLAITSLPAMGLITWRGFKDSAGAGPHREKERKAARERGMKEDRVNTALPPRAEKIKTM